MSYEKDPMWRALAAMRVEPAGAATTFTTKLARETGWSPAYAAAVVAEYRRFLFLAGIAGHPVSPSQTVDKAWHLHLTYSRHYWDELCGRILGRPLHHEPSLGGAAEDARHADQYARTLQLYRDTFGIEPPAAIWPRRPVRKPGTARRVGWLGAAAATGLLAACSAAAATGSGNGSDDFIVLGILSAIGLVAIVLLARGGKGGSRGRGRGRRTGSHSGGSCGSDSWDSHDSGSNDNGGSDGGSSCGGGGCGGGGGGD